jgi:hypothetical protein
MPRSTATQGFFLAYELQQRGWRLGTIDHFFRQPSKIGRGDHDEVGMYRAESVLRIEELPEFQQIQAEQERIARRSLAQEIEDGPAKLPLVAVISRKMLRDSAIAHHNARSNADPRRVPLFLSDRNAAKIEVDYLISHVTPMSSARMRSGAGSNVTLAARTVMAIAQSYSHLREECWQRLSEYAAKASPNLRAEIDSFKIDSQ